MAEEQRGDERGRRESGESRGEEGQEGRGFGSREPGTAGTNRDADESGESKNQGHGHPREERQRRGE